MLLHKVAQGPCLGCRNFNLSPFEEKITQLQPMAVGSGASGSLAQILCARRTTTEVPCLNGKERPCGCTKTTVLTMKMVFLTLILGHQHARCLYMLVLSMLAAHFMLYFSP